MPATERSLAITDAYRARMIAAREAVARILLDRWRYLDWNDLAGSFDEWRGTAAWAIAAGQREAATLSGAYLAAYVASETGERAEATVDPDAYTGTTRDGRPIAPLLGVALIATKQAILRQRPPRDALAAGAARAVRIARTEVMEAGRRALGDAMQAEPRVKGYRRVTSGRRSCGACLGLASGEIRRTNRGLQIHASCRCTAEPVLAGVREEVHRPTGREMFERMSPAEQDATLGPKAALIRSGDADLRDLVATHHNPVWQDTIDEAPLSSIT